MKAASAVTAAKRDPHEDYQSFLRWCVSTRLDCQSSISTTGALTDELDTTSDQALSAVLAATAWNTNADLIVDCVRLGYLHKDWLTLDPTYGKGNWWKSWRPDRLVARNQDLDGSDFTEMPDDDCTYDAVAFDPPYVSIGGRKPSRLSGMHGAYGMADTPRTPKLLQDLIDAGLGEVHRVLKPGGFALAKCQDYISSGHLWLGTHHTLTAALELGFTVQDRLEHTGAPRPQPKGRSQQHARRNLSTLFVLKRGKR